MEMQKPLSRHESIIKYENQIFELISDPIETVINYRTLVEKVIKYASKLLDVDFVEKRFEDLPENIQAVYIKENKIAMFSKTYLDTPENPDEALEKALDLFFSATHEFTHAFDYLENESSGQNREFMVGARGLSEFANLFESPKNQEYEAYANAVYWLSRSEKLARQGSFTLLDRLIKNYGKYIEDNAPHTPKAEEQCQEYFNFYDKKLYLEGQIAPHLASANQEYYKLFAVKCKMRKFLEKEREDECENTFKAQEAIKLYHDKFNEDLLLYSNKLLAGQECSEKEFKALVTTQLVPQTYNPQVLCNFSAYAQKLGLKGVSSLCEDAKELALKRQNQKQKNSEK